MSQLLTCVGHLSHEYIVATLPSASCLYLVFDVGVPITKLEAGAVLSSLSLPKCLAQHSS